VADLGQIVRQASANNQAIYPLGGQTHLALGLPPYRAGSAIDLRGLATVIDYPSRDMTITVQAGITLAYLSDILSAEGQRLPIDVPRADDATLGGAIAVNASGPRRYGLGTFRDYVIGISVINDRGEEVKAGGRVVKNVAGYDLCKLHVGALGTLGIITQVTLKLRPLPEEQAVAILGCPNNELETRLDVLHRSRTLPVCLELLNPGAALHLNQQKATDLPEPGWVLVAGFEGSQEAVAWQVQQLVKELGSGLPLEARVGRVAAPLLDALVQLPGQPFGPLIFQANLLPRACAEFCRQAERLLEGLLLQAHAGNGIVIGHAPAALNQAQASAFVVELRRLAKAAGGQVILPQCPVGWKQGLSVWGPPRGDAWLMRRVKQQLDPRSVFNPGRFVDGI
jgi:glycolate oxidase FAD binding subunit